MSHSKSTVLFSTGPLVSAGHVTAAVAQMTEMFGQLGRRIPPLPSNPGGLAPCFIEVTEYEAFSPRQALIRFYRETEGDLFNEGWEIDPGNGAR
jgi:hypothetical protein